MTADWPLEAREAANRAAIQSDGGALSTTQVVAVTNAILDALHQYVRRAADEREEHFNLEALPIKRRDEIIAQTLTFMRDRGYKITMPPPNDWEWGVICKGDRVPYWCKTEERARGVASNFPGQLVRRRPASEPEIAT